MTLRYQKGDLFQNIDGSDKDIIIAHVCNNRGAWGAGFVIPLGRAFPAAAEEYRNLSQERRLKLGEIQLVSVAPNRQVANMIAQVMGGNRPLRYNALSMCMDRVAGFATNSEIHCPMFGAGLAGGNWFFIEQLIQDCWVENDIPVVVHYLPQYLPDEFDPETMRHMV